MTNAEFLAEASRGALTVIGEHAPDGAVIVQAVTICRVHGPQGGVYVITDVTTSPRWTPPDDTMESEASRLRQHPKGHYERHD